ncbi:MAG TPA: GDP-mannose 4,6-dehydratase [Methylomirabilota bacterium]|nr:GDP-mannose 4,6-dehydratase [Methylomirabilota bacterium]
MMEPGHYLVTGGAGFIGSHLVERLLKDGHQVTVVDDCSTGRVENLQHLRITPNLRLITQRVSECAELREIVRTANGVYHLAAAVGVELIVKRTIHSIETNVRETELIFAAANEFGVRVLLTSSSEVYGLSAKEAFTESDDLLIGPPTYPRWSYACSKLMDEFLGLAYWREKKLPVVITRLFNTVGPRQTGQYGMVVPRFIEAALRNDPIRVFGDGSQTRCFCHVVDTVEALVRLMNATSAQGEIFNVGSTEEVSIRELAERVIAQLGSNSRIEFIPYDQAYHPGFEDMARRKPVVNKLDQVIGFRPRTPLSEIIRTTAESLRQKVNA